MKTTDIIRRIALAGALCLALDSSADTATISIETAVELAQARDPWLQGSLLQQEALQAQSVAAGSLPDPQLAIGFANLPIDSFDFDQEAMTQFKVGLSQVFPRGESLALEQQRLSLLGEEQPHLRAERRARVEVVVSGLWLDAWLAHKSLQKIEADRGLFEYLVDVAENSYSNAFGKTRQQDIIRAQLELTRLDDRLTVLHQQYENAASKLAQWVGTADWRTEPTRWDQAIQQSSLDLDTALPEIELHHRDRLLAKGELELEWLTRQLLAHPAIQGLDQKINAATTGIELAEQKYKPQWGVNASYGYRDDAPDGINRDDFFSVGITFDLPLFTENRQDRAVQSAAAQAGSIKTQKSLALRQLRAQLETQRSTLQRLEQRQRLYQDQLLDQMHEQAEASLTAYTNDDGDFAEVVRARIAELNANIDALGIEVERRKSIVALNYFFAHSLPAQHATTGTAP